MDVILPSRKHGNLRVGFAFFPHGPFVIDLIDTLQLISCIIDKNSLSLKIYQMEGGGPFLGGVF
jgi:hypothetical protein